MNPKEPSLMRPASPAPARPFRRTLSALTLSAALAGLWVPSVGLAQGAFEVTDASLRELQMALTAGRTTSVGLVDAYLARIDAYDDQGPALNALLLSLGLDPTYGAADAFDFLQADVDQNGKVQVTDALAILRISLGLDEAPGWTFIDATADLSGITRNAVPVFNGLDLDPLNTDTDVELVGILLGNIDNYTLA